jgi:hypothetical protein
MNRTVSRSGEANRGSPLEAGHDETDVGEEFSKVRLDLGCHPVRRLQTGCNLQPNITERLARPVGGSSYKPLVWLKELSLPVVSQRCADETHCRRRTTKPLGKVARDPLKVTETACAGRVAQLAVVESLRARNGYTRSRSRFARYAPPAASFASSSVEGAVTL